MTLAELAKLDPNNISDERKRELNRLDGMPVGHLNVPLFAAPTDEVDDLQGPFEEDPEPQPAAPTPCPSCSAR